MKINANFKLFSAVRFDPSKYIESPAYGVHRFMLDRIGSEKARATTIVKYNPNSKFPEHTHIGGEEFLVLEGTFKDQFGSFAAGTYVRNPINSKHAPWVDEDGCTIMVKLLQMAETPGEGTDPLHVDIEKAKIESGAATDYGTCLEMYSNNRTGEMVEFCWIEANKSLPTDVKSKGGEEIFILDGSVKLADEDLHNKWSWLRFPATDDNEKIKCREEVLIAGDQGARVFRKTGHLTEKALSMEKIQISED